MSKHTPGPWKIGTLQQIVRADRPDVAVAEVAGDFAASSEDLANARLIAAAPDLYEALEDITAGLTDAEDRLALICADEVRAARAALKKASGKS